MLLRFELITFRFYHVVRDESLNSMISDFWTRLYQISSPNLKSYGDIFKIIIADLRKSNMLQNWERWGNNNIFLWVKNCALTIVLDKKRKLYMVESQSNL